jgi:hypothetical protein
MVSNSEVIDIPALRPWHPLDQLRLLWWLTIDRARFDAYRLEVGEEATKSAVGWLCSTLICLPSLIVVLGISLGLASTTDGSLVGSLLRIGALVIVWLVNGLLSKGKWRWVRFVGLLALTFVPISVLVLAFPEGEGHGVSLRMATGIGIYLVSLAIGLGLLVSAGFDIYELLLICSPFIGLQSVLASRIDLMRAVAVFFLLLILLFGTDFLLTKAAKRGYLMFWQSVYDNQISKARASLPSWSVLALLLFAYGVLAWVYLLGGWHGA